MRTRIRVGWCILALVSTLLFSAQVNANNLYIGTWKYGDCTLHLRGKDLFGRYAAETNFCLNWASATSWRPTADGIELRNIVGSSLATLSLANGELVVTSSTGQRIAFRRTKPASARQTPPGSAGGGTVPVLAPDRFVAGIACVKRGAGGNCASAHDLGLPRDLPRNSTAYTKPANVPVFGPLNFRAKIGFQQPVHFVIPAGTCIPIWACFDTNDSGPWCVTRLNGKQGYIAKFSRRQGGGGVQVNFGNGCTIAGG